MCDWIITKITYIVLVTFILYYPKTTHAQLASTIHHQYHHHNHHQPHPSPCRYHKHTNPSIATIYSDNWTNQPSTTTTPTITIAKSSIYFYYFFFFPITIG